MSLWNQKHLGFSVDYYETFHTCSRCNKHVDLMWRTLINIWNTVFLTYSILFYYIILSLCNHELFIYYMVPSSCDLQHRSVYTIFEDTERKNSDFKLRCT